MAALIPWLVSADGAEVGRGVEAVGADLGDAVFDARKLLKGGVLMPGYDRTGPLGQGPRTGRGAGKCGKTKATPRSDVGQGAGRRSGQGMAAGRGTGRGGGRGRRAGGGRGRM
jgi:hypothetical protein